MIEVFKKSDMVMMVVFDIMTTKAKLRTTTTDGISGLL
jgi:hypothetical protein